ncbi:MAG: recombinase zinc beta ribbon domain-containing protein, partial [Clostridia bacterium]|nr:recombinase zinc beta ribbon domain-containing protein [Clostridia bacterium]
RSGAAWNPTTISTMLKNPFYTGVYRSNYHNETRSGGNTSGKHLKPGNDWVLVEDHHPAIIAAARQKNALQILEDNRRSNSRSAKKYVRKNTHIFAGLLFCGYCGNQMQSTIDRARSDGYRPSIYACSRKRRYDDCENKYISDIILAPFVLNYIANILKAQNNFGKSTSIGAFERKLLRGDTFSDIEHIEQVGLNDMYEMLRRGGLSDAVYKSQRIKSLETGKESDDEHDLLVAEKRKKERAIARLKSLYLYNDEAISEREYLIEKKALDDSIKKIDSRLDEIEQGRSDQFVLTDDEFMAKASVFVMTHHLQDNRFIDFDRLIRKMDAKIIKEFINSVIQKIVVKSGKIISIRFKNGIEHRFLYRQ